MGPSSESLVGHDEFNEGYTLCTLQQRKRGPNAEHLSERSEHCSRKQADSPPGGNKQLHGSYTWPHLHLFQYQEMEKTWNLSQ